MTSYQFMLLLGTIWIAPHALKPYGIGVGLLFVITGALGKYLGVGA